MDDVKNLISELKNLIKRLNKNYDEYVKFKITLVDSKFIFDNLKSEFSIFKDKLTMESNKKMLIEYQILFDEEIINKNEFNDLKKDLGLSNKILKNNLENDKKILFISNKQNNIKFDNKDIIKSLNQSSQILAIDRQEENYCCKQIKIY